MPGTQDDNADERTPLVNGGLNGSTHDQAETQAHSAAFTFFLNPHKTPGLHSSNVALRSAAYSWHIAKVTILSSTSGPCFPLSAPLLRGASPWLSAYFFLTNQPD